MFPEPLTDVPILREEVHKRRLNCVTVDSDF